MTVSTAVTIAVMNSVAGARRRVDAVAQGGDLAADRGEVHGAGGGVDLMGAALQRGFGAGQHGLVAGELLLDARRLLLDAGELVELARIGLGRAVAAGTAATMRPERPASVAARERG